MRDASANAGRVSVTATRIELSAQGAIATATISGSQSDAGRLEVIADHVPLTGGARIESTTRGAGAGRTTHVETRERLTIAGQRNNSPNSPASGMFSIAFSEGDAGTLTIRSGQITVRDGGRIEVDPQEKKRLTCPADHDIELSVDASRCCILR